MKILRWTVFTIALLSYACSPDCSPAGSEEEVWEFTAGWNSFEYNRNQTDELHHALQSISGKYDWIQVYSEEYGFFSWSSSRPINDLTCLIPDFDYWIHMKEPGNLVLPDSTFPCEIFVEK